MLYKDIDKFRQLAIAADLEPDKQYMMNGNVIRYVSIGKLKRVLAPLFSKAGLDFKFDIEDVESLPDRTRVRVKFILTSIDSEDGDISYITADGAVQSTGGACKSSMKDISIAVAYAMRIYLCNRFMLTDGIESDEEGGESVEDALDRVSVPETKQAQEPTENTPKNDDDAKEVSTHVQKVEPPKKHLLSGAEAKGIVKAMETMAAWLKEKKITEEQYAKAEELYKGIKNSVDVFKLMQYKRTLEADIPKEGGM